MIYDVNTGKREGGGRGGGESGGGGHMKGTGMLLRKLELKP